jgi:hypothetical protein
MPTVSISNNNTITAMNLIKTAMRKINALSAGEDPEADEASDILGTLNGMIDAWAAERLMVFTIQRQIFIPTVFKQVYTVGPGGDFNVPRPPAIEAIGVIILNNPSQPLELPMSKLNYDGWRGIPVKNILSTVPEKYWDDQQSPQRNISIWPVPAVPIQFAFYTWTAINTFQDLFTPYTFPPGYVSAMIWNLAQKISSEFPGFPQATQLVTQEAASSKARVMTLNDKEVMPDMRCDEAVVGRGSVAYDWRTDLPAGGSR